MFPFLLLLRLRLWILTLIAVAHVLLVVLDLKRHLEYVVLLPDAD